MIGAKLYECDDFYRHNQSNPISDTIALFHKKICSDLVVGFDVLCDGMYTFKTTRLELLSEIKMIDCKKILVVMTTPLEECLRRNAQRPNPLPDFVVEDIYNRYQTPTFDEGWDEIIYY